MTTNQLQYQANNEAAAHNRAMEAENERSHRAAEANNAFANATNRSHYRRMDTESARHNRTSEAIDWNNSATNRLNAATNRLNAATNARNADSSMMSAKGQLMRGQAAKQDADTKRVEQKENSENRVILRDDTLRNSAVNRRRTNVATLKEIGTAPGEIVSSWGRGVGSIVSAANALQ